MRIIKIKMAIFVSHTAPSAYAHHVCFLNPMNQSTLETFDPQIIVATPKWESPFVNPTVRYLNLGDEGYGLRPERLISEGREYFYMFKLSWDSSGVECVLNRENVQKILGFGAHKTPIHVFDISISSNLQISHTMRINATSTVSQVGPVIKDFEFISDEDTSLHIGEIIQLQSYTLSDFEEATGIDVIARYFEHLNDGSAPIKYSRKAYDNMRRKFEG